MLVFASDDHRRHSPTEPHLFAGRLVPPSEVPARAEVIKAVLEEVGIAEFRTPNPIGLDLLADVHTAPYLAFLQTAHARWLERTGSEAGEAMPFVRPYLRHDSVEPEDVLAQLGWFSHDADPVLDGTWEASVAAASSAAAAVGSVLDGAPSAYALTRPPGHHAAPSSFGGFCYMNNVAVAASAARRRGARVAILDVDAHAGNGTQQIFWTRSDVLTVSVHADPTHEYPYFHGFPGERGAGPGEGFNSNHPLAKGADWSTYELQLGSACRRVCEHQPDVVIVALGVDTAREDGVMKLHGDDYRRLGASLAGLGVPLAFVQEGGYDLNVIGQNVAATLVGYLDAA